MVKILSFVIFVQFFIFSNNLVNAQEINLINKKLAKETGLKVVEKLSIESDNRSNKQTLEKREVYDVSGNAIEKYYYNGGNIAGKWISAFDSTGNEIKRKTYNSNTLENTFVYSYNQNNDLVSEIWYDAGNNRILTKKMSYKEKNKVAEELIYDAAGKLTQKTTTDYFDDTLFIIKVYLTESEPFSIKESRFNNFKKLSRVTEFNGEHEFRSDYRYNYDITGRLLEEKWIGYDSSLNLHKKYEYDSKNNVVKEVYLDEKGIVIIQILREYDDSNHMISQTEIDFSENTEISSQYFYNQINLPSEEKISDKNGKVLTIHRYNYTYRK